MKRLCLVLLVLVNAGFFAQQTSLAQNIGCNPNCPQGPEIPFKAEMDPLKLTGDMNFGEVSGMSQSPKTRNMVVFHRKGSSQGPLKMAQAAQIWEFAPDGKFIREIGKDLYGFAMAHNVRHDRFDNIWAVDEGANMVIKFAPSGRVLTVWGRKSEPIHDWESLEHGGVGPVKPGTPPPTPKDDTFGNKDPQFGRPTDVAFDKQDNAFISDGYTNGRVVKLDKDGRYVTTFGSWGREPGQLRTVHTIAVGNDGTVYVGDRGNNRISVFDNSGKFITTWSQGGSPNTLCMTPGNNQVLFSQDLSGPIYMLEIPSGKLLGKFGKFGRLPGEWNAVHALACPSTTELWVGELMGWRVQKLTLGKPASTSSQQ